MVMFNLISTDYTSLLFKAYRVFCVLLFLSSMFCLFIRPAIKYLILFMFSVLIPAIMYGIYNKLITMDPNQSREIYTYLGYLSFALVYLYVILVYPLKSFIQQRIGSLYSYLYGLSIITLLGLWPFYSVLEEMSLSGTITLSIIYNNKTLVLTFIVIIVFSFYLIVHKTFFQGDKEKLMQLLKKIFTAEQISRATEQMDQKQMEQYDWYNVKTRIMSMLVLATTLGLEIFIFFNMINSSQSMTKSMALMVFAIIFLIMGTFYIILPISNKLAIPIFTILSLAPAVLSFFISQSLLYWQYICTIFSLPYVILFWSIIRGISEYKPLLLNKYLTIMYIFIHIPIMIFMMDVLNYFNSGNKVGPVGYTAIVVVAVSITAALLLSIVIFFVNICAKESETIKNAVQLDFNYQEPINYKPYKKLNTFTFQWLAEMDLLDYGVFLNCLFFLLANTVAFYNLNQLIYNFNPSQFFSSIIYELTYSEFFILLVFFIYCHYFMSTNNDNWDFYMLATWLILGLFMVIASYVLNVIPNTLRIFGGFCMAMFAVAIGFEYIKDSNKKIIPFIAPVLVCSLWVTILIPYVVGIPTASIYVDQSQFGLFIYNCILASALLLIIVVGVVSMIFNLLINKFQEQKRYKYVIQDVKQFFDEQGIQSNDQILHVFHQAYQSRDKKYMFYLKNGYPINVAKDEQNDTHKLITYDNYVNNKTTQLLPKHKEVQADCCWTCLTCFCGEDDQETNDKLKNALDKNLINQEEAQNLFPQDKFQRLNKMMDTKFHSHKKEKHVRIKSSDVNSTKSLLLNSLCEGPRKLGPEYTLLKLQKSRNLALQIWSSIFLMISNSDKGQNMIIFNDFKKFCEISKFDTEEKVCEQLFNKYAKSIWGQTVGMNEQEFATALQEVADKCYHDYISNEKQRIMTLLVDKVYFNMAKYEIFNQIRKNSKLSQFQAHKSGFKGSLQRYKQSQKHRQKQVQHLVRFYKKQKGHHLDQPRRKQNIQANNTKKAKLQSSKQLMQAQQQAQTKSCKRSIYDNYTLVRDSCSRAIPKDQSKLVKKQKLKPWSYLAQESAKILHRKSSLWQDQHEVKQYEFRCILNNIFIAVFKLADLYAYLEITLRDPQVKWYDTAEFSFLYLDYKYQLYLCLALAFVTVPLGLKGISFIAQDRLGLTQARVPAGFPHPMFFYTVIYKILVLSLFGTISSTFLVTFSCTWTLSSPFTLYQDSSIVCLSTQHNFYIILSLIFLIIYFPLSSYTFPNFQFSQKRLDLKFRPSYLVLYFQINFVLAANKVLLSQASSNSTVEIAYISINIVSLLFLSLVCLRMKPCLIEWFNWIQFLTIFLGVIWNVGGLVLYLTKMWTLCVIVFGGLSLLAVAVVLLVIKRVYFSSATINAQNDQDEVKQLQMGRKYRLQKNLMMIAQDKNKSSSTDLQKMNNNFLKTKNVLPSTRKNKNPDQQLIMVDIISNSQDGEQNTARSSSKDQNRK